MRQEREDYDDKLPPGWLEWFGSRDFLIRLASIALPLLAVAAWWVVFN